MIGKKESTLPRRYEDIYPSLPLLNSDDLEHTSAMSLMSVRWFQAEPDRMPAEIYAEHHILLNLNENSHRAQNIRDGEVLDFSMGKHDVIVTPAGISSGWRWFAKTNVIIVTLAPERVQRFAQNELGMLLDQEQLKSIPLFSDADLCSAGEILRDALENDDMSSGVMFEAMSRVFLVKLLQRYGKRRPEEIAMSARFTSTHYRKVLAYITSHLEKTLTVDDLASKVGMSPSHFNRVFKETLGSTPMQYVLAYRVEQSMDMMKDDTRSLGDIAFACGFADQAHFSRSFKQITGKTPRQHRLG